MSSSSSSNSHFQSFRDLVVWQQSFDFAKGVYALAKSLPADERFGMASQLNRAALAMPAQIAQGQRKRNKGDFLKHLHYALGNAAECETYLLIVQDLFPNEAEQVSRLREANTLVQKMLSALAYSIEHPKIKKDAHGEPIHVSLEPVCVPVGA